eukprot:scaffold175479_cov12-Prasinocladus_malaysianus.AAC.1
MAKAVSGRLTGATERANPGFIFILFVPALRSKLCATTLPTSSPGAIRLGAMLLLLNLPDKKKCFDVNPSKFKQRPMKLLMKQIAQSMNDMPKTIDMQKNK